MKKNTLNAAITAALGISSLVVPTAATAIVADGVYIMVINNTPLTPGTTNPQIGSDGNWNSSFTFGCLPNRKGCSSYYMYDNGATHNSRGSSIGGDGVAGALMISVSTNGVFTVDSFNVDAIFNTAVGTLVQYTNTGTGAMSGVISGTSMSFDPTGRLGAGDAPNMLDRAWNIDNCQLTSTGCTDNGNTAWSIFTTGTVTAQHGSITGTSLVNVGDINSDGLDDYTATLVSAGEMGSAWDAFFGATYYEAWNVTLLSSTIPVPAAAWLFGSGLLGLVGVARRRKRAR